MINIAHAIKSRLMEKHSFRDDYSEGAHPRILEALQRHNDGQTEGYGMDRYCMEAARLIKEKIRQIDSIVHFVSGGTQANLLVLSALLRPYESVIAASSAHIAVHEAGSVEATGHKINLVETSDGKLNPMQIDQVLKNHRDEHMVKPRVVFISQSTESGTLYRKNELEKLSIYCKKKGLYLYMDGARLAVALTANTNNLSLLELADLVDVFYIGGTKNGALLGEAIVITNPYFQNNFRYIMKQKGALLAKGRLFGIQFMEMFRDGLYFELGQNANARAAELAEGIRSAGYSFSTPPISNQIFPIFPHTLIAHLQKKFGFYIWEKAGMGHSIIRLVTSWATPESAIRDFIKEMNDGPFK